MSISTNLFLTSFSSSSLLSFENEYIESTGFLVDIKKDWIHLNLYDIEENHWYECYRRIKDFSKLRENGITELLVKAILEKQKPSI